MKRGVALLSSAKQQQHLLCLQVSWEVKLQCLSACRALAAMQGLILAFWR
jgi:hypothetical protein